MFCMQEKYFKTSHLLIITIVIMVITGVVWFFLSNSQKVQEIEVSNANIALSPGEIFVLRTNTQPISSTDLEYESSNPNIASINDSGIITANTAGTVQITVTSRQTGVSTTCDLTVSNDVLKATSVSFSNSTLSVDKNSKHLLKIVVSPTGAKVPTLTFRSSDYNIVSVDSYGYITANNYGQATIYAEGEVNGVQIVTTTQVTVTNNVDSPNNIVQTLSLSETSLTIKTGDNHQLFANNNQQVNWTSSDNSVATVDSAGIITAIKQGNIKITATTTDNKLSASCNLNVINNTVSVTGITLNRTDAQLYVGNRITLQASVAPNNATEKGIKWESSDNSIATVDSYGVVTGISEGNVVITVITASGNKTAVSNITVKQAPQAVASVNVNGISLDKTNIELGINGTLTLVATINPANATNKDVTWSSGNTGIATVNNNGLVTGIKEGTTTITVTTRDGGKTATCTVIIKKSQSTVISPSSVTLDQNNVIIRVNEILTLKPTITPNNASNLGVTWKSSNGDVASVDSSGTIKGNKVGTATITVTTKDGGKSTTCKVTVKSRLDTSIDVSRITLDKTNIELNVKGKIKLTATIKPDNATNKGVKWSSSDSKVASVDSNGNVTGKKAGKATITVITKDGGKKATCVVVVKKQQNPTINVSSVSLNKTNMQINIGQTGTLVATTIPNNATNQSVTWKSSNVKVATVNKYGFVTAIKAGTTVITVKTKDGGKTAICTVVVKDPASEIVKVKSVSLDKTEVGLLPNQTITLVATINPSTATNKNITWTSSDKDIASVDSSGTVKGNRVGTATITVTTKDGKKTAKCKITVKKYENGNISVSSISLNKEKITIDTGKTYTLKPTIKPDNATIKDVIWSSNNTSVATVNEKGVVTGIKAGNATITATTKDSGKKDTCKVEVKTAIVAVSDVSLNKTNMQINIGETATLVAEVIPTSATNQSVTWTSDNSKVASVNKYGVVKGVKAGTATITVKTKDGGKTEICTVTVKDPSNTVVKVKSVSLDKSNVGLLPNQTITLVATINPSTATNKNITWTSSDKDIASVDSSGTVKGNRVGTATITVTTKDGKKTAKCKITVKKYENGNISVSSISLDKEKITIDTGKTYTLKPTIKPDNATIKDVIWSSNSTSVATVNEKGVVTALKAGKATITATTKDGGKKATCTVEVKTAIVAVSGVVLNKTNMEINLGETATLVANVVPSTATNQSVTWKSGNIKVASVNKNGIIKGLKIGTATITVTTKDGSKTATCTVTVKDPTVFVNSVSLNKKELEINIGEATTLVATINPSTATNKAVVWGSSDSKVAKVDKNGSVTALKVGSAVITVKTRDGSKTAQCKVTVKDPNIYVDAVTLDKTDIGLNAGSSLNLAATVSPSNATNRAVIWGSSDDKVAKVDGNGLVKGLKTGTATITVKTKDGGKIAKCRVEVKKYTNGVVSVREISLDKEKMIIYSGASYKLIPTIKPDNAAVKDITWTSNNPSVATVDKNGVVRGIKVGTATITAKTTSGGKTVTCKVEVRKAVLGVVLSKTSMTVYTSQTATLVAVVNPSDATDRTITWSSSNPTVASVDKNGMVRGISVGSAVITVKTNDGGKTATCNVTVALLPNTPIKVTGVSFSQKSYSIGKNKTITLSPIITPSNATNKAVTWKSSNSKVASVDSSGLVKGNSAGTITITVTTQDGKKTATCKIVVK